MALTSLYVKSFIILRSGGGLTSFNINIINRVNFSGEQIACVAWRFLLCALSNKRGRAEKPRGDWGGSNLKHRLHGRGAFLSRSVRQRTDRSDWFRMFARQSNILVISHERVSRDWTNHLRKTKSKYQRSVDRSVVDLFFTYFYLFFIFYFFFIYFSRGFAVRAPGSTKPPCYAG